MEVKWVALFSQSGSEIKELSTILGRKPDLVLTNNPDTSMYLHNVDAIYMTHNALMESLRELSSDVFVSLNGYLRIIPADICEKLSIVNGHPGLITVYESLRGKDPQQRITPEMEWIGSVCHRVTAGVDEGHVLTEARIKNTGKDYYNSLRETSLQAWVKYFKENNFV